MAKIKHYKVPVDVKKGDDGHVSLTIHEDKQEFSREENVNLANGTELLKVTKDIADFNDQEKLIAKRTLLASEDSNSTFIIIKKLEE